MKCFTISAILLLLTTPAWATDWVTTSTRVTASIAQVITNIDGEQGECTAFSINPALHFFLTAAHCFGTDITVGGLAALVLFRDDKVDLMVLVVPDLTLPALYPGKVVKRGQEVAAFGYAYGWPDPTIKVGLVGIPEIVARNFNSRHLTVIAFSTISGMSGGPVVDTSGRVVSIVQQGNRDGQAGMGLTLEALKGAVGRYWKP